MHSKPDIVIFAGAYQLAASLSGFQKALEGVGFATHAFTLPSVGDANTDMRDDEIYMKDKIQSVLDAGKDVLVVAHSYAGFPCAAAMAHFHALSQSASGAQKTLVGVIYLAAFIPMKGDSVYKCLGQTWKPWMVIDDQGLLNDTKDRHETFFNDCDEAVSRAASEMIQPHSMKAFFSEVNETGWAAESYNHSRAYIRCLQDVALPLPAQDAMLEATGVTWKIKTLDSGHCPFLSMPGKLASSISELSDEFMQRR